MQTVGITLIILGSIMLTLNFLYRYARAARRIKILSSVLGKTHNVDKERFKILSLNVQMIDWYTSMPTRVLSFFLPHKRRQEIIQFLRSGDYDVVLLQEAFNVGFQDRIRSELHDVFTHIISYRPKAPFFRWINNGLMVLSKYPIEDTQLLEFKKLTGPSWWMPKGAIMMKIQAPRPFQLLNTHMQALEGMFNDKYRVHGATLLKQFVDRHADHSMPLLMGGDFNTSHRHAYLRAFCRLFGVKLYRIEGEQKWSWDPFTNPLCKPNQSGYAETLDWIFVKDSANKVKETVARVVPVSISDHFPVEREMVIK